MNSNNNLESDRPDTIRLIERKSLPDKCVGIYGLQNKLKPDKWYVGQSRTIKNRLEDYEKLNCKGQPKIYNALKKYGISGFSIYLIEECSEEQSILDDRETKWIAFYNSVECGYNSTYGGYSGRPSQESIDKNRKSNVGKRITEEQNKKKLRAMASPEVKKKIGDASKARYSTEEGRKKHSEVMRKWAIENWAKRKLVLPTGLEPVTQKL